MQLHAIAGTILLGASLAGCAKGPATAPAIEPIAPVASTEPTQGSAAGSVDGTYRGVSTATRRTLSQCPVPGPVAIVVRNGVVSRTWQNRAIQAQVQPDGTFSTQNGRVSMAGTVRGGKLEMTFGEDRCQFGYSLTKG